MDVRRVEHANEKRILAPRPLDSPPSAQNREREKVKYGGKGKEVPATGA
jgi:hypothetical protein